MNNTTRKFLLLGTLLMATAVGIGAFGAHGLKKIVTQEMLTIFQTGVQYQFYHALGLFAVAFIAYLENNKSVKIAGNLMFIGTTIFSGSLYLLVLLNTKWLGAITPIGGVLMIVSWLLLAGSLLKVKSEK
ncbi:MAG: DUF423 domain-containing protein [Arcobacteraceae bacterium]